MRKSIKRVYHPYWLWEEVKYNMWGSVDDKDATLKMAIQFMSDYSLFGSWMMKVATDWNYSCQQNLTNYTQNRIAWIGQAACAYALLIPESIVRQAWSKLTAEQQIYANTEAEMTIEYWESKQCQNEGYISMFTTQQ